jgi:hypothetical protein
MNSEDVRINHYYRGPGNGSSLEAVHLPTGLSVSESVPTNSSEGSGKIMLRLMEALELKLQKHLKSAEL